MYQIRIKYYDGTTSPRCTRYSVEEVGKELSLLKGQYPANTYVVYKLVEVEVVATTTYVIKEN